MDTNTLSQVLKLSRPISFMRRAQVIGYETRLWRPYPALVDGETDHPVDGLTYDITSESQLERLKTYETESYRVVYCEIDLLKDDGSFDRVIEGITFKWSGSKDELQKGLFNLEQWKREKELQLDLV